MSLHQTHRLIDCAPAMPGGQAVPDAPVVPSGPAVSDAPVVVCGRVLQVLGAGVVLDDGSLPEPAIFPLPAAGGPDAATAQAGDQVAQAGDHVAQAGDHVALVLPEPRLGVLPLRIEVLFRPAGDFPRVDGDFYRLHRDGRRRLRHLRRRGALLGVMRAFFAARGFLEIEAPLLVPSPGLELHLQGFEVGRGRYLITSPEYQLKRLLSAGIGRVYSLGKVFRSGEAGGHHNPEFTMLEWYRPYQGWEAVCQDVEELCAQVVAAAAGSMVIDREARSAAVIDREARSAAVIDREARSAAVIDREARSAAVIDRRGVRLDLAPPWPRLTVAEAVERWSGVRVRGDETVAELAAEIRRRGLPVPQGPCSWDDLFFSVFLDHVEPHLGQPEPGQPARPVVLYDWPAPLCALARRKPGQPQVVERFEAYAAGLELCNGFGELCDPVEQRARLLSDLRAREGLGLPLYPVDERFLGALAEGLPPSGGVALGVDRLLMLALGTDDIADVLPFTAAEL